MSTKAQRDKKRFNREKRISNKKLATPPEPQTIDQGPAVEWCQCGAKITRFGTCVRGCSLTTHKQVVEYFGRPWR
jgi:hypothetical protein